MQKKPGYYPNEGARRLFMATVMEQPGGRFYTNSFTTTNRSSAYKRSIMLRRHQANRFIYIDLHHTPAEAVHSGAGQPLAATTCRYHP